jgi:hypothetical protein
MYPVLVFDAIFSIKSFDSGPFSLTAATGFALLFNLEIMSLASFDASTELDRGCVR